MPFKPGDKNINRLGRPKNAINRSTEQAKLTLARLADTGLNNIKEDIERIRQDDPLAAAKLYLQILEYIIPKQSRVEVNGQIEQRIQQVTVNINKNV